MKNELTIKIVIQTEKANIPAPDLATVEGAIIDFLDTSERLDAGLGYPTEKDFTIDFTTA